VAGYGTLRAVLLDLDDTLTDRVATVRAYAEQFALDFGARFQLRELDAIAAELERIDQNGYNHKRADDIAAHDAWTDRPDPVALAWHWNHHFAERSQPREGFASFIDAVAQAGLLLGVVTNGPADKQRRKLEVLGLSGRLGVALISDAVGLAKPDPRIFQRAAEALHVAPSDCVFVGDNPEKDVLGAAAVGMRAIWFRARIPWPDGLKPAQDSVTSLGEILPLLGLRHT
jgi:putative hydrolase of the HAD superfamily